jgi:tripeptidyl-peptidase-1
MFHDVSNPRSPSYQRFLPKARVLALLAPKEASVAAVTVFLAQHGAAFNGEIQGNLISTTMTAAQAETAFGAKIYEWHHSSATVLHRAVQSYAMPPDIAAAITAIDGLTSLPRVRTTATRLPSSPAALPPALHFPARTCGGACPGMATPAILAARYSLGAPPATAHRNNSMSVTSFMFEGWDQSDLTQFASSCKTLPIAVDVQVGTNAHEPGQEALLDIEYIKALGGAIPLTVIAQTNYQLLDWAKALMAMDDPPLVNSVSYETDESQQASSDFMDACNTQFKALALRGLSLLFATGDQGVCGRSGCGPTESFHPGFPSTSPYVTSVGATDFAVPSVVGDERAWGSSGGGFSNHFPIPAWQQAGVAAYKSEAASTLPPAALWNHSGRGIPDVSALGGQSNPYCVHYKGDFLGLSGTSAATPMVAAVFARLNDIKLASGKPPLGFLNPFIYQNAAAFHDVLLGCNKFSGTHGFMAAKGWDPTTGVGTPNFAALAKLM